MKLAKILIVVATKIEIEQFKNKCEFINEKSEYINTYNCFGEIVDVLVTGIGPVATSYNLTKALSIRKYELCINVGICGSFKPEIKIGQTVNVISDEFADIGIVDKGYFFTLFDMGFIDKNKFPYTNTILTNKHNLTSGKIINAKAITVNSTSGNKEQIAERIKKFNPDVESMEGAAVFYICFSESIKCLQFRTISNYIEERNLKNWDIKLAVTNLADFLEDYIKNHLQ